MSDGRSPMARPVGALLLCVAAVGCNALLGTSDPTVEAVEAGPAVVHTREAGTPDATGGAPGPDADDTSPDGDAAPSETADAADAHDGGSSCVDECTLPATECMADGVATCAPGAEGCTVWKLSTSCGPRQACKLIGAAPTCVCRPSICTGSGTACQGNSLATCGTDIFHCPYVVSTAPCPGNDVCSNPAPSASCTSTCVSTCTAGQTECADSSSLETCGVNPQGCHTYLAATACPAHQTCSGAVGTASCVCDNTCAAAGVACNGVSLQTCSADAKGCLSVTSSTPCTTSIANAAPACAAGACTFTCNAGFVLCNGACVDAATDGNDCAPSSDP